MGQYTNMAVGARAAMGAITSEGSNVDVNVVNSATSAMGQSRPEVKDPDVVATEAAQKPIRDQNLASATQSVINVVNSQSNYSSNNDFMANLYNTLNPSKPLTTTLTTAQIAKVNDVLAHKGDYKTDTAFANAFHNVSK